MSTIEWYLLMVLICKAVVANEIAQRIHSGIPVPTERFPYVVYIYARKANTSYLPLCSGTIASLNFILTAGHCCKGRSKKVVITGSQMDEDEDRKKRAPETIDLEGVDFHEAVEQHVHPNFEKKMYTLVHDVCILKLKEPLNETEDGIRVARISYERFYARRCISVGFGATGDPAKKSPLYYKLVYAELAWRGNWLIRLYFHTVCGGDSGSPLVCGGKVYGVGSFSTAKKCNEIGQDYYAYLHEERKFLQDFISGSILITGNRLFAFLIVILVVTL